MACALSDAQLVRDGVVIEHAQHVVHIVVRLQVNLVSLEDRSCRLGGGYCGKSRL